MKPQILIYKKVYVAILYRHICPFTPSHNYKPTHTDILTHIHKPRQTYTLTKYKYTYTHTCIFLYINTNVCTKLNTHTHKPFDHTLSPISIPQHTHLLARTVTQVTNHYYHCSGWRSTGRGARRPGRREERRVQLLSQPRHNQ